MAMITNSQLLGERRDTGWIRQSLFLPMRIAGEVGNPTASKRPPASQFSYATLAFADTSLGGNRSMNPKPQFTKFADPNLPSLLVRTNNSGNPSATESMGMGRYYAEAIDQNAQRIWLQFGVPAYNSLSNFFTTFYDRDHSNMANSGKVDSSLLYTIGKYAGFITFWSVVPELAVGSLLYNTGKKIMASKSNRPLSKFYYMNPTMPLYWSTVLTIVNALAVNMKLVQGVFSGMATRDSSNNNGEAAKNGNKLVINPKPVIGNNAIAEINELSKILPEIFLNNNGGIDIRAVANRYERLADAHENKVMEIRAKATTEKEANDMITKYLADAKNTTVNGIASVNEYMQGYAGSASGEGTYLIDSLNDKNPNSGASTADDSVKKAIANANGQAGTVKTANQTPTIWEGLKNHFNKYADWAIAEARDGSSFVSFIVEYDSQVSESFNSNTRESDIAARMNEMSRSARGKSFDLANGNVGEGIVADTLESVLKGVGDVIAGVADAAHFSGLSMLGGKAFVDIPEFWDSSSTTFPSSNYNIQLRTPYGNPISVLTNILVPTAMLIAGAAPRTAGRNAYTGPFLCKLWQKGRTQIQLGMITSLSITRGTGNTGWNIHQQPIGVDISMSITNLSKIMHVPITTDLSALDLLGLTLFDEDNNFTDYMAVLGSLGLADQYYTVAKWRLRATFKYTEFKSFLSAENFLTWGAAHTLPGSVLGMFTRQGAIDG